MGLFTLWICKFIEISAVTTREQKKCQRYCCYPFSFIIGIFCGMNQIVFKSILRELWCTIMGHPLFSINEEAINIIPQRKLDIARKNQFSLILQLIASFEAIPWPKQSDMMSFQIRSFPFNPLFDVRTVIFIFQSPNLFLWMAIRKEIEIMTDCFERIKTKWSELNGETLNRDGLLLDLFFQSFQLLQHFLMHLHPILTLFFP